MMLRKKVGSPMRFGEIVIKNLVPKPYRRSALGAYQRWMLRGDSVTCPCCGEHYARFLSFGRLQRENAQCPNCLCLERHRTLWLYFQQKTSLFEQPLKVLHVAPETVYYNRFRTMENLDYVTIDLDSPRAMMKMDLMAMTFPDNTFDVVLCNHVLEHVSDDGQAMREILRVLKPGGWAILQVPLDESLGETFEDPTVTSPQERERLFGQDDHVRLYGRDYARRLAEAGFEVQVDPFAHQLPPEQVARYALAVEDIYRCMKPLGAHSGPSPSEDDPSSVLNPSSF